MDTGPEESQRQLDPERQIEQAIETDIRYTIEERRGLLEIVAEAGKLDDEE